MDSISLRRVTFEREPEGTRLQSGGFHFISKKSVSEQEDEDTAGPSKKKIRRKTRNKGIGGGKEFTDWGARKMILLAVVRKVPKSHHNIGLIFELIGINRKVSEKYFVII